ncbi:MAG: phage tail protein [Lactococcus lactis]|jgi:phage-related protein|uniref:phage tail protein n=1 Tax=Lactococcus lactis TaxID=1358 RepID=UPI00265124D1|nr:phage tail protein [Lactococcus lactis]MDN6023348.1 phage tail protein [Lactobacillus sp.]MDN6255143.1 phage tail protein [Tetragenococcus koreensis]MDN5447255.1 phage tail protein [Lactococcus lactis]MDN5615810.1 phage tail protein [Lactococcus lactis]
MSTVWSGKDLNDFGMRLLAELKFDGAERDIDEIEIPGRDGVVVRDNQRFNPVIQNFGFTISLLKEKSNLEAQIKEAQAFISGIYGFKDFSWEGEPNYIYKAKVDGKSSTTRNNPWIASVDVPVKLFPMKYLKDTYSKARTLKSGEAFQSKGTQIAYPIITLTGTGNVTLTVNGKSFILKNVTGGVVIDCENQVVTDLAKKNSQMDKVYSYPFPALKIGSNTISWDNSAFTGTIIERWCELA